MPAVPAVCGGAQLVVSKMILVVIAGVHMYVEAEKRRERMMQQKLAEEEDEKKRQDKRAQEEREFFALPLIACRLNPHRCKVTGKTTPVATGKTTPVAPDEFTRERAVLGKAHLNKKHVARVILL